MALHWFGGCVSCVFPNGFLFFVSGVSLLYAVGLLFLLSVAS